MLNYGSESKEMLEQVPYIRLKYLADYHLLRQGISTQNGPYFSQSKHSYQKGIIQIYKKTTYSINFNNIYPNKKISNFNNNECSQIDGKPIYIFAIQDSFSKFIIHACLKEQPDHDFHFVHSWFRIEDCFKEAFEEYGPPFELIIDKEIHHHNSRFLNNNCNVVTRINEKLHKVSLDNFFQGLQRNINPVLNARYLKKYVHFHNFQRPDPSLRGLTPALAWRAGSKERIENFLRKPKKEKLDIFTEVNGLFRNI
jgi:hypothetical protein